MLNVLSLLETGPSFSILIDLQVSRLFYLCSRSCLKGQRWFSDDDIIILSKAVDCTKAFFVHCEVTRIYRAVTVQMC